MLDAMAAVQMQEISVHTVGGKAQTRSAEPHAHSYIRAPYGVFETADHYIVVAFASLDAFVTLIGEPSFAGLDDETESWTHRDEIFARTRERLKAKTTAEWHDIQHPAGVWAGRVHGYAVMVQDPPIRHTSIVNEIAQ